MSSDDDDVPLSRLLLIYAGFAAVGAGGLLFRPAVHGIARVLATIVAVVGLGLTALTIAMVLFYGLVWGFVTGTFRRSPSLLQRLVWVAAAIVSGVVLGTGTYSSGPIVLITGPIFLGISPVLLRQFSSFPRYANRRLIVFLAIFCAVSLPVGLTIFL